MSNRIFNSYTPTAFSISSSSKHSGDQYADLDDSMIDDIYPGGEGTEMLGVSYDEYLRKEAHDKVSNVNLMNKLDILMAERDKLLSNIKYTITADDKVFEKYCDVSNGSVKLKDAVETRSMPFEPIDNINTEYLIDNDNKNPEEPEYLFDVSGNIVANNITFINSVENSRLSGEERAKLQEYSQIISYRANNQYKTIDECIDAFIMNPNDNYYKFVLLIRQNSCGSDNVEAEAEAEAKGVYSRDDITKMGLGLGPSTVDERNSGNGRFTDRIKVLEKIANFQYDYKVVDIPGENIINIKTNFFKSVHKCCICNKYLNTRHTIYTLDNKYVWDNSLLHYIENHNLSVEIPNDFVNYINYMDFDVNIDDIENMKKINLGRGYSISHTLS